MVSPDDRFQRVWIKSPRFFSEVAQLPPIEAGGGVQAGNRPPRGVYVPNQSEGWWV